VIDRAAVEAEAGVKVELLCLCKSPRATDIEDPPRPLVVIVAAQGGHQAAMRI